MIRRNLVVLAVGLVAFAITYFVSAYTYWVDVTIPMPPRGEAATNPTYAAERLVTTLGGRATRDRLFTPPPKDAVIVLTGVNWNLSGSRRAALQAWVEAGGRLVVDETVFGGSEFSEWSGLRFARRNVDAADAQRPRSCLRFSEVSGRVTSRQTHYLCDFDHTTSLETSRPVEWALSAPGVGYQALRVRVGQGSVTLVNAQPFTFRQPFNGDHGWVLARASQLRQADEVHFLSESDHPSLLSLIWLYGAPVVWLALASVALMLWRGGIRLGPIAPPDSTVRRSLAEQIRGTGRFALRQDEGAALHAAAVRALDEAARRRVAGYGGLPPRDRTAALAKVTGVAPDTLAHAIHHPAVRRIADVGGAIELLETIRRGLLRRQTRPLHGHE
jgi:hypothetical protein